MPIERIQSASHKRLMGTRTLEGTLRDKGYEFEQSPLVTKAEVSKMISGVAKPCTLECTFDGKPREMPLTTENQRYVYMNLARLINQGEVRGLQVKDE